MKKSALFIFWIFSLAAMSQTPNSNESFREYLQPENYVNVSDSNGTSKDVAILDMQRIWYERLYPHANPVEEGIVFRPEDYLYGSGPDYSGQKGLVEVVLIG